MARTDQPNSATAQFFINVTSNSSLNYSPSNPGYAAFGEVVSGKEVVDEIKKLKQKEMECTMTGLSKRLLLIKLI